MRAGAKNLPKFGKIAGWKLLIYIDATTPFCSVWQKRHGWGFEEKLPLVSANK